ncbi:MAG: RecQ family ATP-dependent DNA helicase [Solirubrobacteraceae bacterium]
MPATTALQTRATELLHELAGPDAEFREHQLEAIADLVEDRARVLCVQRTGWGKSAVYFIATALLRSDRARRAGPTLIVSPLLALMRNQIAAAQRLGIRAHTVNSTNRDAWEEISALLDGDAVDLLLISPERLNNPTFRARMLPFFAQRVGLRVVDEAHCISDWGHDFRPDYRRIAEMLERLPAGIGVLCTTATANDRVVADVQEQLRTGYGDAPLVAYRGPLGRSSLRFEVVQLPGQADRLAWLATYLGQLPGSGIVYTLTKRDAEQVAAWLTAHGVAAEAYTGEIATERRIAVEDRLLANECKCVVATSALGMGYDKPDLGFVVHYQAPGSVIAYYQQVGRAGRAIERAEVVLLRGAEDRRIQDFFIEQAFPRRELVDRVLEHLEAAGAEGASTPELTAIVNLGRGRVDAMLKVLDVEGAVSREGSRWVRELGSDWAYDAERYAHITALRRREQETMASFGADGRCLMRALQEELDDPQPADCGRCSVCTGPRYDGPLEPGLVREAIDHLRSQPLKLETKKMAPDAEGRMRKIAPELVCEEGRALARLGDGGWAPLVRAGLDEGRFPDELLDAVDRLVRAWNPPVRWIAAVPSQRHSGVVDDLAARLARSLGIELVSLLARTGERPPQREMANAALQAANVRGAFRVSGQPPPDACLLLDDVRLSGWTLAMVGGQLRGRGSGPVFPLALATAF